MAGSAEPSCPTHSTRTSQALPSPAPCSQLPQPLPRLLPTLTFFEHAHTQALGEATGLAGLASPLGDLTLIGGRTAVLDAPCQEEAGLQWRPPRAWRRPSRQESPDSPGKHGSGESRIAVSGAGKPGAVRRMAAGLGALSGQKKGWDQGSQAAAAPSLCQARSLGSPALICSLQGLQWPLHCYL